MQKSALISLAAILCIPVPGLAAPSARPPRTIVAIVDTTKVSSPISPYEYGMFIEHIGSLIYRSLWSEMLDDRKFYFPISSKAPSAPAGPAFFRMMVLRRWQPLGPDASIVMDPHDPFVGERSPRISGSATTRAACALGLPKRVSGSTVTCKSLMHMVDFGCRTRYNRFTINVNPSNATRHRNSECLAE